MPFSRERPDRETSIGDADNANARGEEKGGGSPASTVPWRGLGAGIDAERRHPALRIGPSRPRPMNHIPVCRWSTSYMPIGHPIDPSPRETIQCPQNVGLNWIHPWFAHPPNRQRPYIVSDTTPTQRGHLGVTPDGLGLEESGGRKHTGCPPRQPATQVLPHLQTESLASLSCVQLVTKKSAIILDLSLHDSNSGISPASKSGQ